MEKRSGRGKIKISGEIDWKKEFAFDSSYLHLSFSLLLALFLYLFFTDDKIKQGCNCVLTRLYFETNKRKEQTLLQEFSQREGRKLFITEGKRENDYGK